ncbi:folylpolyglutamate synthase, mitochondrial-like isoform X2 [Pararge aegeria]|uniref:folylpolyglutamate synthase, mitochondrial-like isoform X2 n=1 Tax=Pararge aegeria TaxID=116150 RepID=UPI0019D2AFBD|nr:folylpolyglutamate synthase, mitochondrial-like isoform X2 [Pararge aegeria]
MTSVGFGRAFLVSRLHFKMSSSKFTYEDAVQKLNLLQSNKSTIEQIRKDIRTGQGSTSAMCESILRTHGYRTGFYSSPHLVEVRERIRLDGSTLKRNQFAEYFCQVYNALHDTQTFEGDMPKYFAFLTVLAFNVFLKEKVDVAIVEVGIGGIVDYTNILRKVPVVGITALGLDHTSILGNTLPEIAGAKAGIMKRGCEAFTVNQPPEAMDVLRNASSNVECSLNVVPDFNTYKFQNGCKLSIKLEAYQINASLAIQLSHAWMRLARRNASYTLLRKQMNGNITTDGIETTNTAKGNEEPVLVDTLTKETVLGLKECEWPGRYHIIKTDYGQFYLDGAHTKESMEICAQWFLENNRQHRKVLIFSATGDRNAEMLLKPLMNIDYFETVFFVIPTAYTEVTKKSDNYSAMEHKELLSRCKNHASMWENLNGKSKIVVLQCVADALTSVKNNYPNTSVLITGSLHLVGAALSIIDPNLSKG